MSKTAEPSQCNVMDRRAFLVAMASALATAPDGAEGQTNPRASRIGLLHPGSEPPASDHVLKDYIWVPLRELGYVEGKNLVIERKYADGNFERLPVMARDLVQAQVDVILAIGTVAAQKAKAATTTIPIVFLSNVDPVASGLVAGLARPGGNITGVLIAPDGTLASKKLELLKEVVPRATRIALMLPDDPGIGAERQVKEIQQAAAMLRVDLPVVHVRGRDYDTAFATISAGRPSALFVGAHSFFVRDRSIITELAAKHRLPAIYEWPSMVRAGGLMSYGANEAETYRQVAAYVDRVLQGANPGDVPVWQPSKLYLVVNMITAKALGMTLPPSLLLRADEVIR